MDEARNYDPKTAHIFSIKKNRRNFVTKVLSLVSIQLLATIFIVTGVLSCPSLRLFLSNSPMLMIGVAILGLVSVLLMYFTETFKNHVPYNFAALGVFTICTSLGLSVDLESVPTSIILTGLVFTFVLVGGLTSFCMLKKIEFRGFAPIGIIFGLQMVSFFLGLFFYHLTLASLAISCIGAFIFSFYLVFDLQLILDGSKGAITMDDYIPAAVMIYTDIIELFLKIVAIISKLSEKDDDRDK